MKLVVGLGNPGERYSRTRHNVGFDVLDQVARTNHASTWQAKFDGQLAECMVENEKVLLLKPMTFMNRSGQAVRKLVDFYKLPLADILLVCDDLNLPLGRLRVRRGGSSGGQNGLKDVFAHLGTDEVARLRVGIGSKGAMDAVDHVLAEFRPAERALVQDSVIDAGRAVESWCVHGIETAMNRFNVREPTKE